MAYNINKKRDVRYYGRDFESIKQDFINYLKSYFPDTFKDYNEASPGMAFVELISYMGDSLSLYLDHSFNETFLETAIEKESIEKAGRQNGWVPPGKSVASGIVDLFIELPATDGGGTKKPDMSYAPIVKKGTQASGDNGVTYELVEDVDYSKVDIGNVNRVRVSQLSSGIPSHYVLKSSGSVIAATTKETSITVGPYQKFRRVLIPDTDVVDIVSIYDSNNNRYYEVDYLAQDQIFYIEENTASDRDLVPYVLKLQLVPYRFVMERNLETGRVYLSFGNGEAITTDNEYLVPNVGDIILPLYGKDTFTDFQLDPRNFLKNDTFGICPSNTTLTVKYRKGGGLEGNAAVGEINTIGKKVLSFLQTGLDASKTDNVRSSLAVYNYNPIDGGEEVPSLSVLKQQVMAASAAQRRVVSKEDFIMRILSMPPEVGRVFKVGVTPDNYGQTTRVYVICRDRYGYLTNATETLKNNIKSYLSKFRMYGGIDILDVNVIDVGVEVKIVVDKSSTMGVSDILELCLQNMQDHFDIENWQVGQPIVLSDIVDVLSEVEGVISIYDIQVKNKVQTMDGRTYSDDSYNIMMNTEDGIIRCQQNAIFNVRYPTFDLVISAKH